MSPESDLPHMTQEESTALLLDAMPLIDDETLAAWSNPNIKWSAAQKASRHDRLLTHIATCRAMGRRP